MSGTGSLLCVLEHPTQYDGPLWRCMKARGRLQPVIWYASASAPRDREIGADVGWGAQGSFEKGGSEDLLARISALKSKPDAILTGGWTRHSTWKTRSAAAKLGIPVILPSDKTLNEPSPRGTRRLAATMLHTAKNRMFDGFLTTGALGEQALMSAGAPRDRIATGLYPVDCAWWRAQMLTEASASAELRARASENAFVVLAVSKLAERENPIAVVEAFALLRANVPNAFLTLVGSGPMQAAIEERVQALNLAAHVFLAGYVDYSKLAGFYGAADVFIHAPRREPWGISVAEAMACGLPVVAATTVGSAADLVVPGRTGALAAPGDVAGLAAGLQWAAGQRSRRDDLRREIEQRVASQDVTTAAQNLENLVDRLRLQTRWEPWLALLKGAVLNRWGAWSQ